MDAKRFDSIAKTLYSEKNRRQALGALLAGRLGGLGLVNAAEAAAKTGKCKPDCDECNDCKKGKCKKRDGKKACQPGKCKPKADGTVCTALTDGATCLNGTCTCSSGLTNCGGVCKDLKSDDANCGSCDTACPAGQTCCNGNCSDPETDKNNCGTCGRVCAANQICQNEFCVCPAGFEQCNGPICIPVCPVGISTRNPVTCGCCRINGGINLPCNVPHPCCSENCVVPNPMLPNQTFCVGLGDGDPCDFDAQCDSGDCDNVTCQP